jgi:hypothetical protein
MCGKFDEKLGGAKPYIYTVVIYLPQGYDDLLLSCDTLKLRYNPFICFGNNKSLMVELWQRNSIL